MVSILQTIRLSLASYVGVKSHGRQEVKENVFEIMHASRFPVSKPQLCDAEKKWSENMTLASHSDRRCGIKICNISWPKKFANRMAYASEFRAESDIMRC